MELKAQGSILQLFSLLPGQPWSLHEWALTRPPSSSLPQNMHQNEPYSFGAKRTSNSTEALCVYLCVYGIFFLFFYF